MNINTKSVEKHGDDYIRLYADLEMRPWIRSKAQLKCMFSEGLDGIGEVKYFENHIELKPNKPRVQTPHKVTMSVECRLKKE